MIDLDITLLIQLVNFLITLYVLNLLLIRPVRMIVRQRRDTTAGLVSDVEVFTRQAKEELTHYESELQRVREEAAETRKQARIEAEAAGQTLRETATADAQGTIQAARERMNQDIATARDTLQGEIKTFSQAVVQKLLA